MQHSNGSVQETDLLEGPAVVPGFRVPELDQIVLTFTRESWDTFWTLLANNDIRNMAGSRLSFHPTVDEDHLEAEVMISMWFDDWWR